MLGIWKKYSFLPPPRSVSLNDTHQKTQWGVRREKEVSGTAAAAIIERDTRCFPNREIHNNHMYPTHSWAQRKLSPLS